MKFIFDEVELVEFVKHVNSIIAGKNDNEAYRSFPTIVRAIGDATKERLISKAQDYNKL